MCGERAHGLLSRAIKNVRLTVLRWSLVAPFLASVHFVDGFTRVYLPSLAPRCFLVSNSLAHSLCFAPSRLRFPIHPSPYNHTIMQGGCGCCYRWSTLEMTPCYITNIEGKRVSCQPYTRYATEEERRRETERRETDGERQNERERGGGRDIGVYSATTQKSSPTLSMLFTHFVTAASVTVPCVQVHQGVRRHGHRLLPVR